MDGLLITQKGAIAHLQLDNGKANTLTHNVICSLREALGELQKNKDVRGVVLCGKFPFFSAGLDVVELNGYNEAQIERFWGDFSALLHDFILFDKPIAAAITGHSPAGGCVLAICCDTRVMAEGPFQIGLNEVPVGIVPPESIFKLYSFWIGERHAYQNLLSGRLLTTEEALKQGLVDEVVALEEVIARAEARLKPLMQMPPETWGKSKRQFRKGLLASLSKANEDLQETRAHWWSGEARAVMTHMVEALKAKSQKK